MLQTMMARVSKTATGNGARTHITRSGHTGPIETGQWRGNYNLPIPLGGGLYRKYMAIRHINRASRSRFKRRRESTLSRVWFGRPIWVGVEFLLPEKTRQRGLRSIMLSHGQDLARGAQVMPRHCGNGSGKVMATF